MKMTFLIVLAHGTPGTLLSILPGLAHGASLALAINSRSENMEMATWHTR